MWNSQMLGVDDMPRKVSWLRFRVYSICTLWCAAHVLCGIIQIHQTKIKPSAITFWWSRHTQSFFKSMLLPMIVIHIFVWIRNQSQTFGKEIHLITLATIQCNRWAWLIIAVDFEHKGQTTVIQLYCWGITQVLTDLPDTWLDCRSLLGACRTGVRQYVYMTDHY